jgi:hypothetical protein
MKQTFLLSFGIAALAGLASAATVSCTVTPSGNLTAYTTGTNPFANTAFDIATGNSGGVIANSINCPTVDAGVGNVVTSYAVLATGDYTGGPFGTTSGTVVQLIFSTTGTAPIGAAAQTLLVSGGNSSNATGPSTPFQLGSTITPNVETLSAFNVAISSTVLSGTVGDSSGQVVLSYTTAPSGVPEPQTMGLVGSALLAIGLLGRKKMQ